MMRVLVLCGLALAVAAAPYLKQQAAKAAAKHAIEKRSDEKIIYGNHQNPARTKKSDPSMKTKVKGAKDKGASTLRELEKTQGKAAVAKTTHVAGGPGVKSTHGPKHDDSNNPPRAKVFPNTKVPGKEPGTDHTSNLKQLLTAEHEIEEATGSDGKSTGNTQQNAAVAQVYGQYKRPKYVPYNNYYYDSLRQAFRRKRRAVSPKKRSASNKKSRSKRDLGYTGEYYPYELEDDSAERELEDSEISSLLAPYIKDALQERYANDRYGENAWSGEDDGAYSTGYREEEPYWRGEETDGDDMEELLDSYVRSYPFTDNDNGYGSPTKRSGLLGMMPGNRRKRFEYPYSLEPQGHWGAFVPGTKRSRYDDTYEKLYKLAAMLARRNAYSEYLNALEDYKK